MPDPSGDDPDATHFTLLATHDAVGPQGPLDDDRLYDLYAYPGDISRCWVRGNAIASLDGGAATDGTSGGLGGPGDRRLFRVLRELTDVVVVGAGTARAENYSGAQMTLAQRSRRQQRGQAEVPPIALLTRSGHLDGDMPVLTRTEVAPLVLTSTAAAPAAQALVGNTAEVIACSGADPADVDPDAALAALAERGLTRVLCEGGPSLTGTFVEHELLDELCLTTAPMLVGGAAPRIATGDGHVLARMRRRHVISDDQGYLYTRYTRAD
ncbi:pyrimidine reductase family protein [Mycolicibacterium sp. CBM1]